MDAVASPRAKRARHRKNSQTNETFNIFEGAQNAYETTRDTYDIHWERPMERVNPVRKLNEESREDESKTSRGVPRAHRPVIPPSDEAAGLGLASPKKCRLLGANFVEQDPTVDWVTSHDLGGLKPHVKVGYNPHPVCLDPRTAGNPTFKPGAWSDASQGMASGDTNTFRSYLGRAAAPPDHKEAQWRPRVHCADQKQSLLSGSEDIYHILNPDAKLVNRRAPHRTSKDFLHREHRHRMGSHGYLKVNEESTQQAGANPANPGRSDRRVKRESSHAIKPTIGRSLQHPSRPESPVVKPPPVKHDVVEDLLKARWAPDGVARVKPSLHARQIERIRKKYSSSDISKAHKTTRRETQRLYNKLRSRQR